MSRISPARISALEVLTRVDDGAHSDEALIALTAELDSRDAGLARQIALGVLRYQRQLDYLIGHYGAPTRLDAPVRHALRMGIYQIRYLDRVPPHAAVTESVELVKRAGKRSAAGLVNAILRKVDARAVAWPSREIALSCPEWLLARWGPRAETIARHALDTPISGMDPGAKSVVPLLGIRPGETFLDLCAAPGNKTRLAIEAGPSLTVACDRSWRRIQTVPGLRVLLDAARPLPFRGRFDCVLLDAPCSGTGTLARNPEIKWRLRPDDLSRQQTRQRAMITQAVKHGRRIVYATCSLEPEENEQAVEGFPARETMRRWPGEDDGDGFFAAIIEG